MWQDEQVAHTLNSKQRSNDVLLSEAVTFEELLLSEKVLSGLQKSGFYKPSPIQLKAIPLGRCGLDLVVQAKSGTGKTCVFSVIVLDAVNVTSSALQVIVLAPTREIALQIHGVISCIGQDMNGLSAQVFIGGTLVSDDRVKAKSCQIAIGSPGRLKQLIELGVLDTRNVRILVLDEADKLVEEGSFQKQINWIYSSLPPSKQILALSATYPEELAQFLTRYMREPTFVRLDASHPSLLGLKQHYLVVRECNLPHLLFEEKTKHVISLLSNVAFQQALIFSNYHSRAESICEALNCNGWPSTFISGNMEQARRTEAINKLKQFKCRVLVSTDLTSRGIDAQNVNFVINMDVPFDWETYLHRIGRAGRYGSRGLAVSLVSAGEEEAKLLSLAAQCNATLLPVNDIPKELGKHFNSNDYPEPNCLLDDEQLEDVTETGVSVEDEAPAERSSVDGRSDSTGSESTLSYTPSSESSNPSPDDEFLNRVIRDSDDAVPLIPSLKQLLSRTDHLRRNRHYPNMSYKQLKEDYEHYVKTGEFSSPPLIRSNDEVSLLELKTRELTTVDDVLRANGNIQTEAPINGAREVPSKSSRSSEVVSSTDKRNTQPHVNGDTQAVGKSYKEKADPDKNRMQAVRRRHPQSAAAGLDVLKHWSAVEKANSTLSKTTGVTATPSPSGSAPSDSNYRQKPPGGRIKPPGDRGVTQTIQTPHYPRLAPERDFGSVNRKLPVKPRSEIPASGPEESSEESSYDSSEESEASSSEEEEISPHLNYITSPPVLLQFGPTGHCFNPYLCPHPNPAALNEAFVSHQVYHHAMNHARKQIFRFS